MNSFYKQSTRHSLYIHGALFVGLLIAAFIHTWIKPRQEIIIPLTPTLVLDENLAPPDDKPQEKENTKEPDTPPPPKEIPAPPPPPPPPIPEDTVPIEKPKPPEKKPDPKPVEPPKPPEKKPDPKPPTPKPPEKQPEPTKPKEFKKGTRISATDATKKYNPTKQTTAKKLSEAEIQKLLNQGYRPGRENIIAPNEASRCFNRIREVMYEAWDQPTDASLVATLEIRLDKTGRVSNPRIVKSSGNSFFDQSVLNAASSVTRISGLSAEFLDNYETVTIAFQLD